MNGVVFANSPRLILVNLEDNICIDKFFIIDLDPNLFRRRISRNCASAESTKREIRCNDDFGCSDHFIAWFTLRYKRTTSCCQLDYGTYIEAPDYTFAPEPGYVNIEIIFIMHQRNIEFMPVKVHESFPSLKLYTIVSAPFEKYPKRMLKKSTNLSCCIWEVIRGD